MQNVNLLSVNCNSNFFPFPSVISESNDRFLSCDRVNACWTWVEFYILLKLFLSNVFDKCVMIKWDRIETCNIIRKCCWSYYHLLSLRCCSSNTTGLKFTDQQVTVIQSCLCFIFLIYLVYLNVYHNTVVTVTYLFLLFYLF